MSRSFFCVLLFSKLLFAGTAPIPTDLNIAELQWSLCEPAEQVIQKLNLKNVHYTFKAQSYWDTDDFQLFLKSIQYRVRDEEQSFKSTLKINFSQFNDVPSELLHDQETDCEYDHYENVDKIGCKVSNEGNDDQKFMSQDQILFLGQFAGNVDIGQLKQHGPFHYEKWDSMIQKNQAITFDSLQATNGKKFYEISIRVPSAQKEILFTFWEKYFQKNKIQICPQHIDRTKIVLFNL